MGLVSHKLPSGQTILVPEYLVPKGAAAPQAPAAAPVPSGQPDPNEQPAFARWALDRMGEPLVPKPRKEEPPPVVESAGMPDFAQKAVKSLAPPVRDPEKQSSGVNPSTLVRGSRQAPAKPSDGDDSGTGMDPLVRQVFNEGPRGGGGSGKSPGMVTGSIKEERQPGRELLPEQLWAAGLAERPRELYEVDPTVPQSTIGTAEPVMREKLTAVEQGARSYGERGVREFERQVADQQQQALAQKNALVQQSEQMDNQLATIAQRRERIAKLQDVADQRTREAESIEPRTREQIWESKGSFAQIMGAISMALGGYTQGLGRNGGHNPGAEMINKFLDSAVDDERNKHERRQKIGLNAKSDLDKAMAVYGDIDLAAVDVKNRKIANVMALTQNMLAERGLDAGAKDRGSQLLAQLQAQYMEGIRQQQDMLTGHVIKQEVNYKPGAPTGGGGGLDTLARIERAARAKKGLDTISGASAGPTRSIEGDKLNDVNAAMESLDAADAVDRDVKALGADSSDIDDPLSGPLDAVARVVGTGGDGRRRRQSLDSNTKRLARGIQQSLGKSDNDAKLADEMAIGDGSGVSRIRAAETARRQALGRIQTATAGMTPAQREAFLAGLPAERREQVRGAMGAVASPRRAASEEASE